MRKLLAVAAALTFIGGATVAQADEYVKGGFEMTGHVNAGTSYQHWGQNAAASIVSSNAANNGTVVFRGPQGELTISGGVGAPNGGKESFIFFIDEAELDAVKTFGENIRTRIDLSFGRVASGSGFGAFNLEQAYATANIPIGNGVEFLIGRFDAPIGFESVERADNTLFSHSLIFNTLRSQYMTGVKFYYPFSDLIDWHLYIVNNLRDHLGAGVAGVGAASPDSVLPSFGTRLGFNWGEEGKKSTFGISAAAGPELQESAAGAPDKLDRWSYLGDLDWNVWVTDTFAIGGEGIFRSDNAAGAAVDGRYFAGQLNLNYVFNDVWDGTLRYSFGQQRAASATALGAGSLIDATNAGIKSQVHELTLGGQYQIADGAKLQMEYRLDYVKPTGLAKGITHGGVLNFAYSF